MSYEPWTDEEKKEYNDKRIKDQLLESIYFNKRISKNEPQKRAKYLSEKVLNLTMTDHDIIMRIASKQGKPEALLYLEKMFISGL